MKIINRFAKVGLTSAYDPKEHPEWNSNEYKIIREAITKLGYSILEISLVGHIWHRDIDNPFAEDKESLRIYFNIGNDKVIIIPGTDAARKFRIESSDQLIKDINYYFGKGNLDY